MVRMFFGTLCTQYSIDSVFADVKDPQRDSGYRVFHFANSNPLDPCFIPVLTAHFEAIMKNIPYYPYLESRWGQNNDGRWRPRTTGFPDRYSAPLCAITIRNV
ncbi:hypothetical protein T310_8621 [Rasamsonia emersonii CBS 393.64]|uniref:Uncharacterized protein n=1 Tax=Rasamsonia emersonii (strain ATCC 16479 / CBS 393.64 / IMI 116815) TaxID=1408163 RepID=A0A0F4YHX7_RASE3|nr:hypothetical protein T310_8621 [Rasamsonia emersonii CBS 393.64]KKA17476.1 hypothetical protein T310_8621 [Rasamsonia emersonii CBS 393.64]